MGHNTNHRRLCTRTGGGCCDHHIWLPMLHADRNIREPNGAVASRSRSAGRIVCVAVRRDHVAFGHNSNHRDHCAHSDDGSRYRRPLRAGCGRCTRQEAQPDPRCGPHTCGHMGSMGTVTAKRFCTGPLHARPRTSHKPITSCILFTYIHNVNYYKYYLRPKRDYQSHLLKIGGDTTHFRGHQRFLRQKTGLE